MINAKIHVIHPPHIDVEVSTQVSIYMPQGKLYISLGEENPDLVTYLKSVQSAEKQMNEWIRKYDNVFQGLNYWKSKALEKL